MLERALRVEEPARDHRVASALGMGSVYLGFAAWAYVAWYRDHPEHDCSVDQCVGGDGWFGKTTYAGGADKLGHAWATMVLARGGSHALRAGGWNRTGSAVVASLLAEATFFAVEMKDYYYYEFSPGDMTFNSLGAALGLALELSPRLDELVDFRVQYWFSPQYLRNLDSDSPCVKRVPGQPSCSRWNIAEDYSGETYLLAFHLGGIHALTDMKYGTLAKFVDVAVGFGTRNYKPPPTDPMIERHQELFLGLSLNAQGLIDHFGDRRSRLRKVGHGLTEVLNVPYGSLPLLKGTSTTTMPQSGGA